MSVSGLWDILRHEDFQEEIAISLIFENAPAGVTPQNIIHIRTAHYSVYKVVATDGSEHVVRIGVSSSADDSPPDNSGYLGTSLVTPVGQTRELNIARGFAAVGAPVIVPTHYVKTNEVFDLLWLPFLHSDEKELTAAGWVDALTQLRKYEPKEELPIFTNRVKTMIRLDKITDGSADYLRSRYDSEMQELFTVATQWGVVHGDAHGGNAIRQGGSPILYDFDTASWAPSVWDFMHLLNRAGNAENSGFTKNELLDLIPFDAEEINAALALRLTAVEAAKLYREFTSKDRLKKEKQKRMKGRKTRK